jgi:hypothetical protein
MNARPKYWVNTFALAGVVGALTYAASVTFGTEHVWPGVIVGMCVLVLIRSAGAPR